MPADHDTRPLGRTGIHVLPLGIGTNKWRRADREAVLETYKTIHDAGPCMIDTAEIYFSERVVGDCLRAGPTRAVIASKFLPFPGRTSPRRLMSALDGSLARLGLKTIDLYYVHYPLPLIDETLVRLARAKVYTKLDIRQAFHRIRMSPESEELTAFRTRYGLFQYKVLPFGLTNGPATFQSHINTALHDLLDVTCTA